jgi:hypothetical protein
MRFLPHFPIVAAMSLVICACGAEIISGNGGLGGSPGNHAGPGGSPVLDPGCGGPPALDAGSATSCVPVQYDPAAGGAPPLNCGTGGVVAWGPTLLSVEAKPLGIEITWRVGVLSTDLGRSIDGGPVTVVGFFDDCVCYPGTETYLDTTPFATGVEVCYQVWNTDSSPGPLQCVTP